MPFALIFAGAILIVTAVRGTYGDLGKQLYTDFSGAGAAHGFLVWLAAMIAVGALGYSPVLRTPSRLLLALVLLSMVIANEGVWTQLTQALEQPPPPSTTTPTAQELANLPSAIPVQVTGSLGGAGASGPLGQAGQAAGTAKTVLQAIPLIGGIF